VRHWGYAGALPLTRNGEVTGPSGGFGWHVSWSGGAPRRLHLKRVQQAKASVLLLSIAYPPVSGRLDTVWASIISTEYTLPIV